jgi:hypothetical protein
LARGFEAVEAWHSYIYNGHVRVHVFGFLYRFSPIHGFGDHFPAGLRLQERAKALAHNFVIIS